jgi:hypothetical protein
MAVASISACTPWLYLLELCLLWLYLLWLYLLWRCSPMALLTMAILTMAILTYGDTYYGDAYRRLRGALLLLVRRHLRYSIAATAISRHAASNK